MAKLKSSYALQQKADEFDVYNLIDEIEEDIIEEESRGYGEWQEHVCILPNFQEVRKLTTNIKPIIKGRCWLVYDLDDITEEMTEELEQNDCLYLDYIGKDDFEKHGIKL